MKTGLSRYLLSRQAAKFEVGIYSFTLDESQRVAFFSYLSSSLAVSVALSLKHTNPNLTGATISNL